MFKKIWKLVVAIPLALAFAVASSGVMASADEVPSGTATPVLDTPNADGFYSMDDDATNVDFYLWTNLSKGGRIYDKSLLESVAYPIAILANDYLGTDSAVKVTFGVPKLGTVVQKSSFAYYTPTAPGKDSFTYTVSDINGGKHTSTIYTNNVGLDPLEVTPLVNGLKLHNPNQNYVTVGFGHGASASPGKDSVPPQDYKTIKAGGTFVYKPSAREMKTVYENSGRIEYGLILPINLDHGSIWYTVKLVGPDNGIHPAVLGYKRLSVTSFKLTLNNHKSTKKVVYYVTYKKKGATNYTTKHYTLKAHKTKHLKFTKLTKHSKVTVKAKIKTGSKASSYKKLLTKRL